MDAYKILESIILILICGSNLYLRKLIKQGKNFDGILWGILAGMSGNLFIDFLAYFSVKSFMRNLSKSRGQNGNLNPVMRNTMRDYLVGIVIGNIIVLVIAIGWKTMTERSINHY